MEMVSRTARLFLAAWLVLLLLACLPARAAESYLTGPGEAARAVARVTEELGKAPEIHTIRITGKEVNLIVQGAGTGDVNEWRVRRATRLLFFEAEIVSGPSARFSAPSTRSWFFVSCVMKSPCASRKRATRSVGWAPWLSQYCTRSRSILMRSSESLGSSGL